MDAIILCGGLGTRLAPVVSTLPKSLAPVAGRPFLDYLLAWLRSTGIVDRVILATGHLAGSIDQHYGADFEGLPLRFSREEHPLGTGGALLLAPDEEAGPWVTDPSAAMCEGTGSAAIVRYRAGCAD